MYRAFLQSINKQNIIWRLNMTKLPSLLEQRKNEMAAAVAVLKSLLSNPDDFGKLDALGASDVLAGRLTELEQRLAALENATGVSPEVIEHVQNIGVVNPHNITYLILGVDLGGLTFTNAGNAVNPTDVPNLQQVQALIESTLEYSDLTVYEPAFDKNTAFNKNFGNTAGTVAEGNHTHDYLDYLDLTAYEPAFDKNTAFNKNFGNTAGTVAEGNHAHSDLATSDHNHNNVYAPIDDYVVNINLTSILAGYEPIFTKNTAFNKNFGTEAGTVAEGNHTHEGLVLDEHNHDTLYEPKNDNIQLHIADVTNNPHQISAAQIGAEPAFTKETGFNLPLGTTVGTVAEGNHNHDGIYVPMIGGLIPLEYIPDTILGQVEYQGTWNAALNTPVLPDPTTVKGHYYVVNTDGVYSTIAFEKGDWIISDGIKWDIVKNTDAVRTVFGRLGDIEAEANDYVAFYELKFAKNTAFNKDFGTEADTVAEGNHIHDFVFEEMKTAFNKDFGTTADTVAEGNHEHDYNYGGTTRPTSPILYQSFFDVNLGKPIWFNGASWVDAMGNVA
jgi:hypothetical protein